MTARTADKKDTKYFRNVNNYSLLLTVAHFPCIMIVDSYLFLSRITGGETHGL